MQLSAPMPNPSQTRRSRAGGSKTSIIYLVCILGLGGLVAVLLAKNQSIQKQLEERNALAAENETLKGQVAELDQLRGQVQELEGLRQTQQEVLKLRSEVNTLRGVRDQLTKLQSENAQLKSALQKAQATVADANALRNQNQQLQGALAAQQENAMKLQCIENLKAIQAFKQAWAQDNNRQVTEIPPDAELFGPNRYLPQKPACPGGGAYTVGAVQNKPTCNLPGHALP